MQTFHTTHWHPASKPKIPLPTYEQLYCYCFDQNKEKVIADLRNGERDVSKDDEAIIEQIKMEKSMVEQQLSKAEGQLEQLRTELTVHHDYMKSHRSVDVLNLARS